MAPLTKPQLETYQFIKAYIKKNGLAPTLAEIGQSFGIKVPATWDRVRYLIDKGYLRIYKHTPRGLECLK